MLLLGGFAGGLLHPLLAPAHLLSLIGLGLLAGRGSLRVRIAIVAAFAAGLGGGLGAIAFGAGETSANNVLLAAAAACGVIAALGLPGRAWFVAPLALIIGSAVGLDSPPETISMHEAVLMLTGTFCGGVAALALLTAAAAWLAHLWRAIALRVAGSWIAAIAILVLALRLAG
jgi:urease accessory protein